MHGNNIDDFFIPDNEVKLPEELDYTGVVEYIRSPRPSRSIYMIDYIKRNIKNQNI